MTTDRESLENLVKDLDEAFNGGDLERVMSFYDEDSVYDEFHGARHYGKAAIRKAFEPQFRGDFGRFIFHQEDIFIEAAGPGSGKVMFRWLVTIEEDSRSGGWRGLDIFHFEKGRIKETHTYAKTRSPLLDKKSESERVRRAIEEGVLIDLPGEVSQA